jgi:hypothetical protein
MATIPKTGILTGQAITSAQILNIIQALDGTDSTDIVLDGIATLNGTTTFTGQVNIAPSQASTGTNVLTVDGSGRIYKTGSYSAGGSGGSISITADNSGTDFVDIIVSPSPITGTGTISADLNATGGGGADINKKFLGADNTFKIPNPFPYTGSAIISGSINHIGRIETQINPDAVGSIAIGNQNTLGAHTDGTFYNIAIGDDASQNLTTGANNVAIGQQALMFNLTSNNNVAIGRLSARELTGTLNVSIGNSSMQASAEVDRNVAIGNNSMYYLSASADGVSDGNVGIGDSVAFYQSNYMNNVAIGQNASRGGGFAKITDRVEQSVFVGDEAGYGIKTGSGHVFMGYRAGYAISNNGSVCKENVIIGWKADETRITGNGNTYVGSRTENGGAFPTQGVFNETVIGVQAQGEGNNSVRLGGTTVATLACKVALSVDSDARIKTDVVSGSLGLNFINSLNPVRFKKKNPATWDEAIRPKIYTSRTGSNGEIIPAESAPPTDENYYDGLIAQEVSASLSAQGTTSDIWKENDLGKQSVKYGSLTVPLIKAVQELTLRVEALEAQINGEM